MLIEKSQLRRVLDDAYVRYGKPDFIPNDPILIPHKFSAKEDIEISGFLTATIAWGQRQTIINNANKLLDLMDHAPHDFVRNHLPVDRKRFEGFVHRTFQSDDVIYFLASLQRLYTEKKGLESAFGAPQHGDIQQRIAHFHKVFFELPHLQRTKKHVSNPVQGSSAKRINMFLRWMVRPTTEGVDFGLWNSFQPSELIIPLDVHTGNVGRSLGLLTRKQSDWKSAYELTQQLRMFDPADPVKYDFALFGMGVAGEVF